MRFIIDKKNFNFAVNLEEVIGIVAPDTPTKNNEYYILFYTKNQKNFFWLYETKEKRDFVYNNYLLPMFHLLDK